MKEKKAKGRPLLPQVLCGLLLCFTVLIFAPVEMVAINSTNFWFGVGDFLPAFALLFAAAFVLVEAVFLLLRKLPYALYMLALSLLFGVTLCVYIQGTYLCLGNEVLTAGDPLWRNMLGEMVINTAIWAAVILASVCFALLKPKIFMKVVSAACALVLVMEGTALVFALNASRMSANITSVYCSNEDYFTLSDNGDVVVVMLDTFDNRLLERAVVENPEYADVFSDFTFYENTSSSYGKTDTSFTSFMTGKLYHNEEPIYQFCRDAFRESRFFPALIENGMSIQIYGAPIGLLGEEQLSQVTNLRIRESEISSYKSFLKEMLCMIGYRYAPKTMQPFLIRDFINGFSVLQKQWFQLGEETTDDGLRFYNSLRSMGVTKDDSRRFFKFYTLLGAHDPVKTDRHMQEVDVMLTDRYEQLLGYFLVLDELFAQMKAQGVYDNSTVIVMGDHGMGTIANPAFLVKYPGETGEVMRRSDAPVELLDLRATCAYGAGIDPAPFGTPAHEWEGVTDRERRLIDYEFRQPSGFNFYLNDMTEYIVPQDAADLESYVPSGNVYKMPQ